MFPIERKHILHAYGAHIIYTDPGDGSDGAIRAARELYAQHPDKYFYADQYSNDANWQAHYHGTANEIWQQTEGRVTHFVSMMGTSGTFVGTTRRLKELNPAIRCISLQPDSPFHGIEGAKHMASAIIPKIYDAKLADEDIGISTEDAYGMAKRLAREEGLLVGISAAAAVVGCLQVARKAGQGRAGGICDDSVRLRRQIFEREILGGRVRQRFQIRRFQNADLRSLLRDSVLWVVDLDSTSEICNQMLKLPQSATTLSDSTAKKPIPTSAAASCWGRWAKTVCAP